MKKLERRAILCLKAGESREVSSGVEGGAL